MPGLPVALLPCEHGFEQEVAAGAQDLANDAKNGGKSFRNVAEAELAIRSALAWSAMVVLLLQHYKV